MGLRFENLEGYIFVGLKLHLLYMLHLPQMLSVELVFNFIFDS